MAEETEDQDQGEAASTRAGLSSAQMKYLDSLTPDQIRTQEKLGISDYEVASAWAAGEDVFDDKVAFLHIMCAICGKTSELAAEDSEKKVRLTLAKMGLHIRSSHTDLIFKMESWWGERNAWFDFLRVMPLRSDKVLVPDWRPEEQRQKQNLLPLATTLPV